MASIGHIAMGLLAARFDRSGGGPFWRRSVFWSAMSMAPDADVVAFALGIPYSHPLGHRGASHSLVAALVAALALGAARRRHFSRMFLLGVLTVGSHAILDAFTDGGLGVALAWPFSNDRFFAPWRPIPVAPIGLGFLSTRGMVVAATELFYFLPIFVWALWPRRKKE
jgi:inner membrane protein